MGYVCDSGDCSEVWFSGGVTGCGSDELDIYCGCGCGESGVEVGGTGSVEPGAVYCVGVASALEGCSLVAGAADDSAG